MAGMVGVDRTGYNAAYATSSGAPRRADDLSTFVACFERQQLSPVHAGGGPKGYAKRRSIELLADALAASGRTPEQAVVLDAGCGLGDLGKYLAASGYNVVGIDISEVGVVRANEHARALGLGGRCRFVAASLEEIPIEDGGIDYIIGHAALHHFIKYPRVPQEFQRILRDGGGACFVDAFGENRLYRLFHDRAKMERLGDVVLNRRLIREYFSGFDVELVPTDWLTMTDKLLKRTLPKPAAPAVRAISRLSFAVDRRIPPSSSLALYCAGTVMTVLRPRAAA